MGTVTFSPDGLGNKTAGWDPVGTTSEITALSDGSNSTYVTNTSAKWAQTDYTYGGIEAGLPANSSITGVQWVLRGSRTAVTSAKFIHRAHLLQADGGGDYYWSSSFGQGSTIHDYGTPIYDRAPDGSFWTPQKLEGAWSRIYQDKAPAGRFRLYELSMVVYYAEQGTLTVEAPSGNLLTGNPQVTWTFSADEAEQDVVYIRIFPNTAYNAIDFHPDRLDLAAAYFEREHSYSSYFFRDVDLETGTYKAYVMVLDTNGARTDWVASPEFTISNPRPNKPILTATANHAESCVDLQIVNSSNLLSFMQSSAQEDTINEPNDVTATNCVISEEVTIGSDDSKSYKLTASGTGTIAATFPFVRCPPSKTMYGMTRIYSDANVRTATVTVEFFNSAWSSLGSITNSESTTVGQFSPYIVCSGTSPANTKWAKLSISIAGNANGEVHYIDKNAIQAESNIWSVGGFAGGNILDAQASSSEGIAIANTLIAGANTTLTQEAASGTGAQGNRVHRATATGNGTIEVKTPKVAMAGLWDEGPGPTSVLAQRNYNMTFLCSFKGQHSVNGGVVKIHFYYGAESKPAYTMTAQATPWNNTTWTQSRVTAKIEDFKNKPFDYVAASVTVAGMSTGDSVDLDMLSISCGQTDVWRQSSMRDHRIALVVPQIEYSDDGGETWKIVDASLTVKCPLYSEETMTATYKDHAIVPFKPRRYRARTFGYSQLGNIFWSYYSIETPDVTVQPTQAHLKDIEYPERNMVLPIKYSQELLTVTTERPTTIFHPLGRSTAVALSDGFKSVKLTVPLVLDEESRVKLMRLMSTPRPLWLQLHAAGKAWWVKPIEGLEETLIYNKDHSKPILVTEVSFLETKAPE